MSSLDYQDNPMSPKHVELTNPGERSSDRIPRKSQFKNFTKEQKGRKVTLKFDADGPVSMEALQQAIQASHGDLQSTIKYKAGKQRRETRMMIGLLVAIVGVFGILGIIGGTSLLKVGEVEDKLNSGDAAAAIATKTVNLNSVMQTIAENGGADGQLTEVGLAEARKQFSNLKKAVVTDETGQNSVCNVAGTIVKRDGSVKIECQDGEFLAWTPGKSHSSSRRRRSLAWWDNFGSWWGSKNQAPTPDPTPSPTKAPTDAVAPGGNPPSACNGNVAGGCKTCVETNDAWCSMNGWDQACLNLCAATCKDVCVKDESKPEEKPPQKPDTCFKGENECARCVHKVDNWCFTNAWDNLCEGHCTTSCSNDCKVVEPAVSNVDGVVEETKEKDEPIDCVMGAWSPWSSAEFKGEKCTKERTRQIQSPAQNGGKPCENVVEEVETTCEKVCGDGHVVDGEACDDGNVNNGDGCSSTCTVEDGWKCSGGTVLVKSKCEAFRCGDGRVTGDESKMQGPHYNYMKQFGRFMGYGCDDGNNVDGDGCSSDCKVEAFHICNGGDANNKDTCSCLRYRRDYNTLSRYEKDTYIAAVNELKKQGKYDMFVRIHAQEENKDYAHGTSGFLPWHRKYLLEYEEAIRNLVVDGKKIYSCVTVPYWDWGEDVLKCEAKDGGCKTFHEESEILKDFGGPGNPDVQEVDGHGMWGGVSQSQRQDGHPTSMGCVTTPPFNWIDYHVEDAPTCLTRGINWKIGSSGHFTGAMNLRDIIGNNPEYGSGRGFRARIEGTPHAMPHNLLGGHIRSFSSPADPLFFSHHAFVDKVWANWQDCHDHDEVSKASVTTKEYQGTQGDDNVDDPFVMWYPSTGGKPHNPALCSRSKAGDCKKCVVEQDSWCGSNDFDQTCSAFCSGVCVTRCGGEAGTRRTPDQVMPESWDKTRNTPRDYHSIHDLGERSYLYFPDEFELEMGKSLDSVCKVDIKKRLLKSGHEDIAKVYRYHKTSSTRRALLEKEHDRIMRGDGRRARQLQAPPPVVGKNAGLEGHTKVKGCACKQTWALVDGFYCDNYCCVDPLAPQDGGFCFVEDPECEGHTWGYCNMVGAEEDAIAVAAKYYDAKFEELKAQEVAMRDSAKAKAVLPKLVDLECEILYGNDKPETLSNREWAMWGMSDVDEDIKKSPCA